MLRLETVHALEEQGRYLEALEAVPDVSDGRLGMHCALARGRCLHELGRYPEASAALELAAAFDPVLASVYWARTLRELGQIPRMVEVLRAGFEADPTHDEAMIWLANTIEEEEPEEAERLYREALKIDDGNGATHGHLANLLFDLGRRDEACHHYERAFALGFEPPSTYSMVNYALLLNGRARPNDAIRFLERAHNQEPESLWILSVLALLKSERGDHRSLLEPLFERTLADADEAPEVLENYASALARWGDTAKAVRLLNTAVEAGSGRAAAMLETLFDS